MTEAYYFRQLDKAGQAAYHAMKTGLAALRPAFPVPRLEGRELGDVLARLRLDCPELFYVTGFSSRGHPAAATVEFLPQYLFDKGKIQTHQKALAARLDRLCRPAMGLNEGEKERYVHDFICRNVRYDKLKKPYSHEILGPLLEKRLEQLVMPAMRAKTRLAFAALGNDAGMLGALCALLEQEKNK